MADFEQAFEYVMQKLYRYQSGFVTVGPKGEKIRFGINSITYPDAEKDLFYVLPHEQARIYAKQLCRFECWMPIGGYNLLDQMVANTFLDLALHLDPREATRIFQKAANLSRPITQQLSVDGIAGAFTVAALNAADPVKLLAAVRNHDPHEKPSAQVEKGTVYP